jgi:hypothetical protein
MALGKLSRLRARLAGGGVEIRYAVAAGAAAATNIPVAGIKRADQILLAVAFEPPTSTAGSLMDDVGDEVSIPSDGNIQLSTTATTGKQLLVVWAAAA